MGQHKHNPNCQLAKEGKLPPKPKKLSKKQQRAAIMKAIYTKTGIGDILQAMGRNSIHEAEIMDDLLRRR